MSQVFGFHRIDDNLFTADDFSFTETYYDCQNVMNPLGWIPVFGSVVGVTRAISTGVMWAGDSDTHRQSHKKYFRVSGLRSLVEFLGLGLVFVIPDIWVTVRRRRRKVKVGV